MPFVPIPRHRAKFKSQCQPGLLLKALGEGVAALFDLVLLSFLSRLFIEGWAKRATGEKNNHEQR